MPFACSSRRAITESATDLSHTVKSGCGYKNTSGCSNGKTANTGDLYVFVVINSERGVDHTMRILVTGSVAAGKTTIAQLLREQFEHFEYINVSDLVISKGLFVRDDPDAAQYDTHVVDDDALIDYIRTNINCIPNVIFDHHSVDIFGNKYFDLIIVVTCHDPLDFNLHILRKRLEARGYAENKIQENLQVEMLQIIDTQIQRFHCHKMFINNIYNNKQELLPEISRIKNTVHMIQNGEIDPEQYEDYEEFEEFEEGEDEYSNTE